MIPWNCSPSEPLPYCPVHSVLFAPPYKGVSLIQKHILWLVYDGQEDLLVWTGIRRISLIFQNMKGLDSPDI